MIGCAALSLLLSRALCVVAPNAGWLPVVAIPEQGQVAFVWFDVIDDGGQSFAAESADFVVGFTEKLFASPSPRTIIV